MRIGVGSLLRRGESEAGRRGSFAASAGANGPGSVSEGKTRSPRERRRTDFDGFDSAFGSRKVVDRRDRDGVVLRAEPTVRIDHESREKKEGPHKCASSPAGEVYAVSADDFVSSFARNREQAVRQVEPDREHVTLGLGLWFLRSPAPGRGWVMFARVVEYAPRSEVFPVPGPGIEDEGSGGQRVEEVADEGPRRVAGAGEVGGDLVVHGVHVLGFERGRRCCHLSGRATWRSSSSRVESSDRRRLLLLVTRSHPSADESRRPQRALDREACGVLVKATSISPDWPRNLLGP